MQTKLEVIQQKVMAYHKRMNAIADFLYAKNAPEELLINKYHEHLEFYIDKDALKNLNKIAEHKDCHSLVVMFGIGENDNPTQITACILGVDQDREILKEHKHHTSVEASQEDAGLDGEDTWPPPSNGTRLKLSDGRTVPTNYFTLTTPEKELEAYFK